MQKIAASEKVLSGLNGMNFVNGIMFRYVDDNVYVDDDGTTFRYVEDSISGEISRLYDNYEVPKMEPEETDLDGELYVDDDLRTFKYVVDANGNVRRNYKVYQIQKELVDDIMYDSDDDVTDDDYNSDDDATDDDYDIIHINAQ
jgi:hypothetical protein